MDNIIVAVFEEEGEAYKAFSSIRNDLLSSACKVTQLALVERKDGKVMKRDFSDSGIETTDDIGKGALIGGLIG
ncbi:MAG: hypothetical protein ACI4U2_01235 [Christensenellaceae bacterium]